MTKLYTLYFTIVWNNVEQKRAMLPPADLFYYIMRLLDTKF